MTSSHRELGSDPGSPGATAGKRLPFAEPGSFVGAPRFFGEARGQGVEVKSPHPWPASLCKETKMKIRMQIGLISKPQG